MEKTMLRGAVQALLGLALTGLFFYMMLPFIMPILLGAVMAIICFPLVEKLQKYVPKTLSALVVVGGVIILIVFPIGSLLYMAAHQLVGLFGRLHLDQSTLQAIVGHPLVQRTLNLVSRFIPAEEEWLKEQALAIAQISLAKVSALVAAFISGMPGLLLASSVLVLSGFFFLIDGPRFLKFLGGLSPLGRDRSEQLYQAFETSCRGVVLGLFASSAVQAILMAVFFKISGLPNPILAAVVTFIMGMIPVVGSAPIWIGATVYLFFSPTPMMALVMLIGGILISTADNVVRPLLMAQAEMHPLLALVSVFGAVNLFGPTGIFVGPVIAAVFVSFLKIIQMEFSTDPPIVVPPSSEKFGDDLKA